MSRRKAGKKISIWSINVNQTTYAIELRMREQSYGGTLFFANVPNDSEGERLLEDTDINKLKEKIRAALAEQVQVKWEPHYHIATNLTKYRQGMNEPIPYQRQVTLRFECELIEIGTGTDGKKRWRDAGNPNYVRTGAPECDYDSACGGDSSCSCIVPVTKENTELVNNILAGTFNWCEALVKFFDPRQVMTNLKKKALPPFNYKLTKEWMTEDDD